MIRDQTKDILPVVFKEDTIVKESWLDILAAQLMIEIDKQVIKKLKELTFDDKGKERTKAQIIKLIKNG